MLLFEPRPDGLVWVQQQGDTRSQGILPLTDDLPASLEALPTWQDAKSIAYLLLHGGQVITQPVKRLSQAAIAEMVACLPLSPVANQATLQAARVGMRLRPDLDQCLLCDTAFFSGMPDYARTYALPDELQSLGLARFGRDGLFHAWAGAQAALLAPGAGRVVSLLLNQTPSLVAQDGGKPVEITTGYRGSEKLPTATACGNLDPSVVLNLAELGMSAGDIIRLLTQESGWKALAGQEVTLDQLLKDQDPQISFARRIFTRSLLEALGMAFASLGGVDALVVGFSGEPDAILPMIRTIFTRLAFTGARLLEHPALDGAALKLTAPDSAWPAWIIPYDLVKASIMLIEKTPFIG